MNKVPEIEEEKLLLVISNLFQGENKILFFNWSIVDLKC